MRLILCMRFDYTMAQTTLDVTVQMLVYHCLCLIYGISWNWIRYLVPDLFFDNENSPWNSTMLPNSPNTFLNFRIQWNLFRHTKNENNKPAYTSAAIFITIQAHWLTKVTKILTSSICSLTKGNWICYHCAQWYIAQNNTIESVSVSNETSHLIALVDNGESFQFCSRHCLRYMVNQVNRNHWLS